MVCSTQTVHLSWIMISTRSKRTETSFHLSLVTQEYHPVRPKQFLSLWYVWRKPCTYHAPKLTLSPKGPKGDTTWLGMKTEQKYFELTVFVFYIMNRFLTWKIVSFNWFHNHFLYSLIAKCGNIPNWPFLFFYIISPFSTVFDRFHPYTWPTSSRSSIGCVQNDLWGYGMFDANYGSILHRD
jgi:hypothetical protein